MNIIDFIASVLTNPVVLTVLIAALIILALIQGREITLGPLKIGAKSREPVKKGEDSPDPNQNKEIYKDSDNKDFATLFEKHLREAGRIIMIGTGFNILQREGLNDLLAERVKGKCHIEIYAANPFSPNVQTRLIEEEVGDKPKYGKPRLISWLGEMVSLRDQLEDKSTFILHLFPFYPTYALFIFNSEDYFYYPYGYVRLGNRSPVMYYSAKNPLHKDMIYFLNSQYTELSQRSSDAELIYSLYRGGASGPALLPQLTAFAVYIVPPATADLYEWGSKILEYDVRKPNEQLPKTPWHNSIGAANDFGLHITIADALYCSSLADVNLICKEVEFIAREFRPFTIELSLEKDFPNERGIALVCQDATGSLEALHHEMVTRAYSKAIASNYSLGLARADRDPDRDRAKLMIEHYHAPYILQRFRPHFSLLSDVPPEKKDRIYQEIRASLEKNNVEMSLEVRKIAIMKRSSDSRHWKIRSESGKIFEYPLIGG